MTHHFTTHELYAYDIMCAAKGYARTTDISVEAIRKEIDEFMHICEQIKNERAIIAMQ